MRPAPPEPTAPPPPRGLARRLVLAAPWIFGAVVMVQSFHMMEHAVQMVQRYGLAYDHAHGLLGAVVDREVVHFTYNVTIYAAFLALLVAFGVRARWRDGRRAWMTALVAASVVQTYHVGEHVLKLLQHAALQRNDTPGLLGQVLPVIPLHFAINLAMFAPLLASYLGWRRARLRGAVDRPLALALRLGLHPRGPLAPARAAPAGRCRPVVRVRRIPARAPPAAARPPRSVRALR